MKKTFHEGWIVGLLLSFIGGATDIYTYIQYNTFASAQTGNIILAVINGINGSWIEVFKKILSTFFFFTGILLAKFMISYFQKNRWSLWRLGLLYFEAAFFSFLSLTNIHKSMTVVITLLSFISAAQWVSFDKINGRLYTSLFTTGNLKGLAIALYDYIVKKDKKSWDDFIHFLLVVLFFIFGVVLTAVLYKYLQEKTTLIVSIVFLFLAISQTFSIWNYLNKINYK